MNTTLLPFLFGCAAVNVAATLVVFVAHARRWRIAIPLAALLPVLAVIVVFVWSPQVESKYPLVAQFGTMLLSVAVVWFPGVIVAFIGARNAGRARVGFVLATSLVAAALGAFLPFVALAVACTFLGECL